MDIKQWTTLYHHQPIPTFDLNFGLRTRHLLHWHHHGMARPETGHPETNIAIENKYLEVQDT